MARDIIPTTPGTRTLAVPGTLEQAPTQSWLVDFDPVHASLEWFGEPGCKLGRGPRLASGGQAAERGNLNPTKPHA